MRNGTPIPVPRAWINGRALLVVDTYCICECHQVIIARRMDISQQGWVILVVILPADIGFGDYLDYNQAKGEFHLLRGPVLRFKLHTDCMPPAFVAEVVRTLPANNPNGEATHFYYPDPNGEPPNHE